MLSDAALERRREREFVLAFLKRGGRVLREDLGGAIGVHWGRAHRSGPPFDTAACERLLEHGCKIDGQPHRLIQGKDTGSGVYWLEAVDEPS